jgi:hypothetical protein
MPDASDRHRGSHHTPAGQKLDEQQRERNDQQDVNERTNRVTEQDCRRACPRLPVDSPRRDASLRSSQWDTSCITTIAARRPRRSERRHSSLT